MLTLCHGTNMNKLADHLLQHLNQNPAPDPLAPEVFVVQNHGLGQWLSLYMARREGVAANMKFEFPAERMWSLARVLDPDIPQTLPSDRGPLAWSLMRLLQDEEFMNSMGLLSRYTEETDPLRQEIRKWKLSEKIAEVFDQYLVFRPDLLLAWENEHLVYKNNKTEKWQAGLWRKLISSWENSNYESRWLHRAKLQEKLLSAIDNRQLAPEQLPHRVTVFGVSGMPPVYIRTLINLSKLIDVHFYQLNVNAAVRKAEDFQNTLLQSLGKEGTDFLSQFEKMVEQDSEVSAYYNTTCIPDVDGGTGGLNRVRNDLISDIGTEKASPGALDPTDQSIQVHSCHSPMREVEVLYDQLLALLEQQEDLHPEDIVVMTPDISTYAPMIDAVFGNPDEGQPEIPFSIADRGINGAYPSIQVFQKLLDLSESRYKVTDVLDVLDAVPLQEAFDFSDDDLKTLEKWISDNRIRWGIDGPFKQELGLPSIENCTWRAGLDRMILGYAMKPEEDSLYNGIFPYYEIETSDHAALIGRFSHFTNELFRVRSQVKEPLTPEKWKEVLLEMVDIFLADNREQYREISQIRTAITRLQEYADVAGFTNKISFRIVRTWLQEQLEDQTTGGGRIGQGVTFSSLVPMRSIPFKVIGMIGMNEGAFPRSKIHAEFDLMQKEPRKGDRSRTSDDRYLFLENLLSAQSHVYFSYVGQSNRQDSSFPPSVVLKEFLDYLAEQYEINYDGDLIRHHPLQAFSPAYFKNEKLFTYSYTQQHIAGELLQENSSSKRFMVRDLPEPDEEWRSLSVSDLINYYQHPAKYVLRQRIGIHLYEEQVLDEDREPFNLSGLDKYEVKQALLDLYLEDKDLDQYREIIRARDLLPQDWIGDRIYSEKVVETKEFGDIVDQFLNQQLQEDCEVDLEIDPFHLVGKLTDIYEEALVKYRYGRCRAKDQVEFWISHLLFQLVKPNGHPGISRYIYKDSNDKIQLYQLSPVENAGELLEELLSSYWAGLTCCSYFFPETSYRYAYHLYEKGSSADRALEKAKDIWINEYSFSSDGEDPYNKLMIESRRPLEKQKFREAAEEFWAPFFQVLNQKKLK